MAIRMSTSGANPTYPIRRARHRTFADADTHPFAAAAVSSLCAASGVLCHSRVLGRRVVRALLAPPDQG